MIPPQVKDIASYRIQSARADVGRHRRARRASVPLRQRIGDVIAGVRRRLAEGPGGQPSRWPGPTREPTARIP